MIVSRLSGFPHASLTDADHKAIARADWRVFSHETVRAVAEVWNAGIDTASMAAAMQCTPPSLRMLLGRLTQLGVVLRRADGRHEHAGALSLRRFSWEDNA